MVSYQPSVDNATLRKVLNQLGLTGSAGSSQLDFVNGETKKIKEAKDCNIHNRRFSVHHYN